MSVLSDPVVTLEGVSLESISLSTIALAVTIRVENKNPVGATLESCPFTVSYRSAGTSAVIATGDTGSAKIAAGATTVLPVRVSSHNTALPGALAAFVAGGSIELVIEGTARIKFFMIPKVVPFSRKVPITAGQIAGMVTGQKKKE
ncbi:LEA type 2 family protein [Methanoregula sp.]|uniref:LEA type 2 family protein n=1 Tax=Methanoregula sp. TaxID=2052170 RepID=UPI002BE73E12|nr:LEA type 2 family protein [Methanoregula sp.]HVP95749.1 LEA type 2 family protein [Methanoregula sp.]